MDIRFASQNDSEKIGNLHADSWRTAYCNVLSEEYLSGNIIVERVNFWNSRLAKPAANLKVAVAEEDGQIADFACVLLENDPQWGSLLDNLHVAPTLKRSKICTLLIAEVARVSSEQAGHPGLYLWVLVSPALLYLRWRIKQLLTILKERCMRLNVANKTNRIFAMSLIIGCSGCGTMTTLSSSDAEINRALIKRNTYCASIPRVYSGAYYDVCHLHAKQIDQFYEFPDWTEIYLVDIAFSGVLDTVVLPFTIYNQFDKGSIEVEN